MKKPSKKKAKQAYDDRERLEIILSALNTGLALTKAIQYFDDYGRFHTKLSR